MENKRWNRNTSDPFVSRVSNLEVSGYEEIAYVTCAFSLPDQTIAAVEAFFLSLDERLRSDNARHTLFLCHASEDKGFVDRLDQALRRDAQLAWYDRREIFVGDSIVSEINTGLSSARFLIAVLSPRSVTKPWVVREINSSIMRDLGGDGIRVLPVVTEDCDLPPLLSDIEYADFRRSFEKGYSDLLAALQQGRQRAG